MTKRTAPYALMLLVAALITVALVGCVMTPSTELPTNEPEPEPEQPPLTPAFPETRREASVELYDDAHVHVLGATQLETKLRTVGADRLTFAESVTYQPGDFITAGVSDKTPHGMLRVVVSVQDRTVVTAPASVEDVVEQGTLRISGTLGPDDLTPESRAALEASMMGRPLLTSAAAGGDVLSFRRALGISYEGTTVRGSVEFKIGYELVARYDVGLKDLRAAITAAQTTVVSVTGAASIMKTWQLGRSLTFKPIVIPTPLLPLAFTPELEFYLGVEGGFDVEVNVRHDSVVKIGVECGEGCDEAGNWRRLFERSGSPPSDVSSVETVVAGNVRVLLSPKLTFSLYENPLLGGLGGLSVQADPYLEARATIDRCPDPHLSIHAGLEATFGGSAEIFGRTLYDVSLPTYAVITPTLLWDRWACLKATPDGNRIDVTWFEPPGYLMDPIKGYRVEFREDGTSAWQHLADTKETSYQHVDLPKDTRFHYRVRAITAKGPGWPSKPASATTGAFRDCEDCPLMVDVPAGTYVMGSPSSELGRDSREGPRHTVTIGYRLAVGVYEVTFAEWDACVADGGCGGHRPREEERDTQPVEYVNWSDAQAYVQWLSGKTGRRYRLLSEAEWEYVARAGTTTAYHTGSTISRSQANYFSWGGGTVPVGSYPGNAFGLHDVHGNVAEWTQDCWNDSYAGAPADGSAWESGDCDGRVVRGGSYIQSSEGVRSAWRTYAHIAPRGSGLGFRVARTLDS